LGEGKRKRGREDSGRVAKLFNSLFWAPAWSTGGGGGGGGLRKKKKGEKEKKKREETDVPFIQQCPLFSAAREGPRGKGKEGGGREGNERTSR